MPAERTEITEIVTGLAMLGYQDLDRALEVRPRHITHVTEEVFSRLERARHDGKYDREFSLAWNNGMVFARASNGLRGRPPWLLEWKGSHRPASKSIETIPADLRVDHVYLISCKYGSEILHNSGPAQLFDQLLAPSGPTPQLDWYETVAADSYRQVWEPVHRAVGIDPVTPPTGTATAQRSALAEHLKTHPIDTKASTYQDFIRDVSETTAHRWQTNITNKPTQQREMLWRLLRMQAAPYYVLGANRQHEPLRYRVSTPWDFNQRYTLDQLTISAAQRGQPAVNWSARITHNDHHTSHGISGYVEIRWTHGKLNGVPEAKIHLTTDPHQVPGYEPLTTPAQPNPANSEPQPNEQLTWD